MTCKRNQQEQIQQYKSPFQIQIFFFLREKYEHSCHGNCRISGNAPLDHVLTDQISQILLIINLIIQQRHIIFCLKTICTKKCHDHRKKDHRSDHQCHCIISNKLHQPVKYIFHASFTENPEIAKCSINKHKNTDHIKEIEVRHGRYDSRPDKQPGFLFFINLINSHQNQWQITHRIGKIWMLHGSIDRPSRKNIDQSSHKSRLFRILMVETENTERNPCKINPQKDQNLIQSFRLICRYKHRQ